jgi:hypothetical protein
MPQNAVPVPRRVSATRPADRKASPFNSDRLELSQTYLRVKVL